MRSTFAELTGEGTELAPEIGRPRANADRGLGMGGTAETTEGVAEGRTVGVAGVGVASVGVVGVGVSSGGAVTTADVEVDRNMAKSARRTKDTPSATTMQVNDSATKSQPPTCWLGFDIVVRPNTCWVLPAPLVTATGSCQSSGPGGIDDADRCDA